jgi:hypothetical protein
MSDPMKILSTMTGALLPPVICGLKVLIPTVCYNNAEYGATVVPVRIWGDNAYLVYADPSGMLGGWAKQFESLGMTIVKWRENDPAGWWVKAHWERVVTEVTAAAVHEITDVT